MIGTICFLLMEILRVMMMATDNQMTMSSHTGYVKVHSTHLKADMSGLPLPTSTLQSLKFFEVKMSQNLTNVAHDKYVKLVNSVIAMNRSEFVSLASTELTHDSSDEDGLSIDSTKAITKTLVDITGIKHMRYHCCVNSCIAYTEPYHLETQCPFPSCNEPRCDGRALPRQTYDLIPIAHRLRLQYANSKRAEVLKGYRKRLVEDPW